jgi:glucose/arabinose dehydrogenase
MINKMPVLLDQDLKIELIFAKELKHEGGTLSPVTSMAFLDTNDILILNKNNGTVHRIMNGVFIEEALLDVNVANKRERGMLGITTSTNSFSSKNQNDAKIFLYYTESEKRDGSDVCRKTYFCKSDSETIGNNLYKYELKDNKLVNPKLLLHLPAWPAPAHNGGILKIGPDDNLYITIGDLVGSENETSRTKVQNYENGTEPDGRAGILRITQQGKPVTEGILGEDFPLNLYYAYGIRNSFGIDFDPLTGKLWDTENGPDYGDEINLVEPGFNSGWHKLQGIWKPTYDEMRGGDLIAGKKLINPDESYFVAFNGKGKYSPPEFTWNQTIGPTAIKFLNSEKYPNEYKNDLFVGDTNNGYLYHFDLDQERKALKLNGPLEDKVADNNKELAQIIFGVGFGKITDIELGPDGYLYILSHNNNTVSIFKIIPAT